MTADFAAAWYSRAATQGRQVAVDSRCGLPGDFDTPKYARYGAVQRRKWESNLGMGTRTTLSFSLIPSHLSPFPVYPPDQHQLIA